ncbi:MAG: hypothetical protein ACLFNO_00915 [Parcubacteria group bacterium]
MSLKKILIIITVIVLVGVGVKLYIYFQFDQMKDYYSEELKSNQDKIKDVNLKVVTFSLRDILQDWGQKNNSFDGFYENDLNNRRIDTLTEKEPYNKANAEHMIFTTNDNYVIKVKAINEKLIYCVDSISTISPEDPNIRIISFNGNNFNSKTDCLNEALK